MKQLIISLGRQVGSGGHKIAEALAERFSLPLYDKNLIAELAAQRELSKLPKKGRPLSLRGSLQDMYTIRLPMYRRFADITVANDGPAETVAQTVEEAYEHFSD